MNTLLYNLKEKVMLNELQTYSRTYRNVYIIHNYPYYIEFCFYSLNQQLLFKLISKDKILGFSIKKDGINE
jgi:hypothetical protein